jgi:hypothetical protein
MMERESQWLQGNPKPDRGISCKGAIPKKIYGKEGYLL